MIKCRDTEELFNGYEYKNKRDFYFPRFINIDGIVKRVVLVWRDIPPAIYDQIMKDFWNKICKFHFEFDSFGEVHTYVFNSELTTAYTLISITNLTTGETVINNNI